MKLSTRNIVVAIIAAILLIAVVGFACSSTIKNKDNTEDISKAVETTITQEIE